MSNQVERSNVLVQECSNFFCCDSLILTLNRDGDGFALLDAKSHDCHQLAHITGLAIFFNGDLAGILLCQLDQQTGGAGVDAEFVLDGIIKTDEPRTLDFSGVRGFLVTNVCIVQRSAA